MIVYSAQIELAILHDGVQTNDRSFSIGQWQLLDRADVRDRFRPGLLDFIRDCEIPFDADNYCSARQLLGCAFAHVTRLQQPAREDDAYIAVGGLDYFPDEALARGSLMRHAILVIPVREDGGVIRPVYLDPRPGYGIVELSVTEKQSCERYFFR